MDDESRALLRCIGVMLMVASLAVVTAVGIHASALGDDPAWAFDCNDTTCTDLWAGPRLHYRRIALASFATGILGWALRGIGLSSSAQHPIPARGRPATMAWSSLALVAAASSIGAAFGGLVVAGAVSIPAGLAVVSAVGVLSTWVMSVRLRYIGASSRTAWFGAGGVLAAGCATMVVATGLLFPVLFVVAPLLAVVIAPVGSLVALALLRASLGRGPSVAKPDARSPEHSVLTVVPGNRWSAARLLPLLAVGALIAALAIWAGWPVPALPADAWKGG